MKLSHLISAAIIIGSTVYPSMADAATGSVNVRALSEYVYPNNRATSVSLTFMPDGLSYLKMTEGGKKVDRFDVLNNKYIETVFDVTRTRGDRTVESIDGFELNPDGTQLLVYINSEPIYRHSFRAEYFAYEISRRTLKPLSAVHKVQQAPVMSPDGRMVAFMAEDNNIYVAKLDYGTEVAVTTDGKVNSIINGVPDWTYQEEFATYRSMEWAPDNSALSYLKYNETEVPAFSFQLYQGSCDPMNRYALYPGTFTYKYPVAGEKNSVVTLHSYDVTTRKTKNISLPDPEIEYIPRIHYGPTADVLMVATLNRDQNKLEIYNANPRSTVARSVYSDRSTAWITPQCYESISCEPTGFVVFSDRTGFSHLYRYSYSGSEIGALTSGNYDVTCYYGTSADGSYYYQSAVNGPLNRVITRVDKRGTHTNVTPAEGWASASFSPQMNFYVVNYSNAAKPPVYTLMNSKDKTVRTIEDNNGYTSRFADAPGKEFFTIQSDGHTLNGWIIKPVGFSQSRKYPVVVYQYSGPGSQEVVNRWSMDWAQYFATQGYIVACVDGRGTGGRGREFEQCTYRNLGHYETIDQLALLSHLRSLPYVKADGIGIFGWSYGGYETLMAASAQGATYAAAVAVAPVTSWRYYDTVYAERYMTTPRQNPDGYDRSAPIERTGSLRCPLLIMSGTADDNVHMSNTMEYVARLQADDRWADMLLFPNMNHSINGCNTRAVVYARMLSFFNTHLK